MEYSYEFPENRNVFEMQPVPLRVPFGLTHIVCTCSEDDQMNREPGIIRPRKDGKVDLLRLPDNLHTPVCRKCFKYFRWVMRTCVLCKEPFTATFSHPNYCRIRPACWNCLEELGGPMCEGAIDDDSHINCTKGRDTKWVREKDLTRHTVEIISDLPNLDFEDL